MEKHAEEPDSPPHMEAKPPVPAQLATVSPGIMEMRAITISHLYGSGGGEIGARLAQRLHWELVDHEIVAQVAERLGISVHEADARDEHSESFFARMLRTIQVTLGRPPTNPAPLAVPVGELQAVYHSTLATLVRAAAEQGHVIIIGRGSQVVLASRRDVLHVRIVAPLDERIEYVARREGVSLVEAELRIRRKDRDRIHYLRTQYHQQSDDPLLYDLVVNTAVLDLDSVVQLVETALATKAARVGLPAQELGPAAGQTPYPGEPGDPPLPD
jgi:cytidylate kinase